MTIDAQSYASLTRGCGVADFSDRTQIEVAGADAAAFLHNLCTNDVRALAVGDGCEAFLCNVQGKILAHMLIFRSPHSLVLETVPGQAGKLLAHLDRYIIREQVTPHDRSAEWGELLAAGAECEPTLLGVTNQPLPKSRLTHIAAKIGEHDVFVRRVDLAGPVGFLVACRRESLDAVRDSLVSAGAVWCDPATVETVRIESGWPLYGRDITEKNLPQEVGRNAQAISFSKGCYLGQETVARIDALGHVNRHLVGVRFDGRDVPAEGIELTADNQTVGHVTSATFSPRLDAPLALAYLRRGNNDVGMQVESLVGLGTVLRLPI